ETFLSPDPLHHTDSPGSDPLAVHQTNHDLVVGTPEEQDRFWFAQHEDMSCGPAAVAEVISHYTGVNLGSESEVISDAYQHHLVEPDANGHFPGSSPELEVQ